MTTGLSNASSTTGASSGISLAGLIGPMFLPDAFAPTRAMNLVRVLAGLFYAPHVYQKLSGVDGSLAFFEKAGLTPAPLFLGLALLCESLSLIGLVGGLFARWTGLLSAGCMVVAAYAIFATKGVHWYWAQGGVEYLVFWGVVSLAIALDAWGRTTSAGR